MKYAAGVVGLALMLAGNVASAKDILPRGWIKAGSLSAAYTVAVKPTGAYEGHAGVVIRSKRGNPKGFGTLMQTILANSYLGRRIRFSGYLRAQDVSGHAGLWMRVDGPNGDILGIDNMDKRSLHGNVPWKFCEIVMDVPEQAKTIAFGALLSKAGEVEVSDLKFEIVGKDVPVTSKTRSSAYPQKPINLDFK